MDPLAVLARGQHLLDLGFSLSPIGKPDSFALPPMATHVASSGLIDSDDDFGEFEFVPANAFDTDRSSTSFPDISVSDSVRDSQSLSGMRDSSEVSSNAHLASAPTDLFGLSTSATVASHFPSKKENNNMDLFEVESWNLDPSVNRNYDSTDIFGQFSSISNVSDVSDKGNGKSVADIAISFSSRTMGNTTASDDLFGDFSFAPSAGVGSVEIASDVHGTAVQEDFFAQFSGTSDVQTSKKSFDFERGNEQQLEASSDDDWGDFVEHSTVGVNRNLQEFHWVDKAEHNVEDHVPNTPGSVKDSHIWVSNNGTLNAEIRNEHVKQHLPSGLALYDANDLSNMNGNSNIYPERVAGGEVAQTSELSGLYRTQSDNLMSQKRIGSLIDLTSAPIPLSLFGDEEPRDEPLQSDLQNFPGHSRTRSLSNSLSSANGMNLTDLIASLYTVPNPEQDQDASHLNKEEKEQDQNLNNASLLLKDEECLFDLTLASSLKQCEDGSVLSTVSVDDKHLFVKAWADVLAVCESELEHASNVWKQAHNDGLELDLLADLQGKNYFAAIGQIYVVVLILASTLNVFKPWLAVASKESKNILASLHACKIAWMHTNLREAVQFSLNALKSRLPSSVVAWEGIQNFPSHAKNACEQTAKVYEQMDTVCNLSLLPFIAFHHTGLQTVQWSGSTYFLPLANIWANYVSNEPPVFPCLQSKSA